MLAASFFLSRSADSQMDFDLELAKKQSADNPVYYVQYAHARIASIIKLAEEKGITYKGGDVSLLKSEPELTLIRQMVLLPEVVETVATLLEPQHLPYYAINLATAFHSFYKQCRVVSKNQALTASRLKLVRAAQIVLAKTLHLSFVDTFFDSWYVIPGYRPANYFLNKFKTTASWQRLHFQNNVSVLAMAACLLLMLIL